MTPQIITPSGKLLQLPLFDPNVAERLQAPHSYVETLLHQINVEKIYAPLFEGKSNLTFLDLGANIGLVSLYAAEVCSRIVSVEPDPDTFKVLKSLTMQFPQIECANWALTPIDGTIPFYQNDLNTTASSTVNTYGKRIEVTGYRLHRILNILQLESVDVCKADVEGSEGESLTLEELGLARNIVKSWLIEVHNDPKDRWEDKLGRLVRDLSTLGYHEQNINGMVLTASRK